MIKKIKKQKGYTIIETMIAISLFIIIVMSGMGALLNANLLHQKSQSMRSIMDSLSFVIEDMGRNLRTGYNYYCITGNDTLANVSSAKSGQNCWGIGFESAFGKTADPNDQWVYYIGTNGTDPNVRIYKSILGPYISSSFVSLTTDEIVIDPTASGFSVLGAEPVSSGDKQQPFVTIRLVGHINLKGVITPFSLQTSVSQRAIDVGN